MRIRGLRVAENYRTILRPHLAPRIGNQRLQNLRPEAACGSSAASTGGVTAVDPSYRVMTLREEAREGRSFSPDEFATALEQVAAGTALPDSIDPTLPRDSVASRADSIRQVAHERVSQPSLSRMSSGRSSEVVTVIVGSPVPGGVRGRAKAEPEW